MESADYHLLPGERLLWSGRPQRFSLRGSDIYLLAFGALWVTVTGGFLGLSLRVSGPPIVVPILFLVFGASLSWGRVFVAQLALRSTTYLLTDRRVVAVATRPKHSEQAEY